ncbi:MAG: FAD:protein FMN transferase [Bacteroides sp.]|nr:FAD:protein FMN transferase [Bacteroides sp.]
MEKKHRRNFMWLAIFTLATIGILARHNAPAPYQKASGLIFGTMYSVTYQSKTDLKASIDSMLKVFDGSLSPFNDTATISRINRNEPVIADELFATVFRKSMEVSEATNGAFDITVAPLVNAWGFGFKQGSFPDSMMVDSLLQLTGYQKVSMNEQGEVTKQDERMMLNCSAIAKGYAVDVIANLLKSKGVKNMMVDIGGEVVVHGKNPKEKKWRIGINKPVDDSLATNQELERIVEITDAAIATSGNYRNFYYNNGKKYAHTIDPSTGYPVQHSLLSATVVANDCMTADAYATAFMVMGVEKALEMAEGNPAIEAFFIFSDEEGDLQTCQTSGF